MEIIFNNRKNRKEIIMVDFFTELIVPIVSTVIGGVIIAYIVNYWRKNSLRLFTDPNAEKYKINIIREAREHKNDLYPDNDAFWYKKSIDNHHLWTYINFLLQEKKENELKVLLGVKDRYFGYFRKIRGFRNHYNKLKGVCEYIGEKYRNSETLKLVRFKVKQEGNKDVLRLEESFGEKLDKDDTFVDMIKLEEIIREANKTLQYYAEIGQLKA